MELLEYYKLLKKHKRTIILVPLITVIAAFIIVRFLPNKYVSHTKLATGITDKSRQIVGDDNNQDFKVNQEFNNITQMILLNKIIDQVSYKLAMHDLTAAKPFRESKDAKALDEQEKQKLLAAFNAKYQKKEGLSLFDKQGKELNKFLASFKYDNESLKKHLKVSRLENSDFINMEFDSDNPQLSAFVLNTLSSEFIDYYSNVVSANKTRAVTFFDSVLRVKQNEIATISEALKEYKIKNKVLNLEDQSRSIYTQITDLATKRSMAQKDEAAYSAALRGINSHFDPKNRGYFESSVSGLNQEIASTKEELKALNDAYIKSDFDPKYKSKIDSVQTSLTAKIHSQNDNVAYNPLAPKENLVNQRVNIEVSRDLARNSINSLDRELGRLNSGLEKLVPDVANIQSYEDKLALANKEYAEVLKNYNQASMEASYILPVRQVEMAMPEDAEPSRKLMLVFFSGALSLVLCLLVFFVIFYFDRAVYSPVQLQESTGLRVLGSLNLLSGKHVDMKRLWMKSETVDTDKQIFKDLLRSLRFEIESDLQDSKVIAITSLANGAGKTFFTTSLAYAFSKINKKVLVIDGNFIHPTISNSINEPTYLENFLLDSGSQTAGSNAFTIIGNKGGDNSLLELTDKRTIEEVFRYLRTIYDVILIETSTMENASKAKAKEWIMFSDKVITVVEAGKEIDISKSVDITYFKDLKDKFSGLVLNKIGATEEEVKEKKHKNAVSHKNLLEGPSYNEENLKPAV
jgi:uncharacterized protein involved in exopolysaccharide biosynthesis/Mrp family chromosome partitioning ATPase